MLSRERVPARHHRRYYCVDKSERGVVRDKPVSPRIRRLVTIEVDLHVKERAEKAAFKAMLPVKRVIACQPPEADARQSSGVRDCAIDIFDRDIRHIELWYLLFNGRRGARVLLTAGWFSAGENRRHS